MHVPYDKPFNEFLGFINKTYPTAPYPEAYIPYIAHKATAGYAIEKYFPELVPEFVKRNGQFAYAISEPGWKNSPMNLKSELVRLDDGSFELTASKSFILDAEIGVFAVKYGKEFALVIVDTDLYRTTRVMLDMPEATYRTGPDEHVTHFKAEFRLAMSIVPFRAISKREMLLLARNIVYREQVAYSILAAAEAAKHHDMSAIHSRVSLLCQRAKEEPGNDDIAVAREILSACIVRIVPEPNVHGFWKWLGRFVKPMQGPD